MGSIRTKETGIGSKSNEDEKIKKLLLINKILIHISSSEDLNVLNLE